MENKFWFIRPASLVVFLLLALLPLINAGNNQVSVKPIPPEEIPNNQIAIGLPEATIQTGFSENYSEDAILINKTELGNRIMSLAKKVFGTHHIAYLNVSKRVEALEDILKKRGIETPEDLEEFIRLNKIDVDLFNKKVENSVNALASAQYQLYTAWQLFQQDNLSEAEEHLIIAERQQKIFADYSAELSYMINHWKPLNKSFTNKTALEKRLLILSKRIFGTHHIAYLNESARIGALKDILHKKNVFSDADLREFIKLNKIDVGLFNKKVENSLTALATAQYYFLEAHKAFEKGDFKEAEKYIIAAEQQAKIWEDYSAELSYIINHWKPLSKLNVHPSDYTHFDNAKKFNNKTLNSLEIKTPEKSRKPDKVVLRNQKPKNKKKSFFDSIIEWFLSLFS